MSLPNDDEIVTKIRSVITNAFETDTLGDYTKRKIRESLREHFGVDLESKKKFINETTADQIKTITEERRQAQANASTSKVSPQTKKLARPVKAKPASSPSPTKREASTKRKAPSLNEEGEDEPDGASAGEESEQETEEQFSELEEDTSVSRKKPKVKSSKSSPVKATNVKKSSTGGSSTATGSEAELARLKKLVSEAGVRKPWKRLYEAASVDVDDFAGQCRVVQGVMRELGFSGRGSIEQARKIRDQREFADELAALQDNPVIDNGARARRTRASVGSTRNNKKSGARASITASDGSDDDASDFQDVSTSKPQRKSSMSTAKIQADSDSQDTEDQGPTTSRKFKSSLASFAADLNSDSD